MKKKCFKCGEEKSINEFYKHPRMSDGHLGKCKSCSKKDVRLNYCKNIDQYKEYDRKRMDDPKRMKKRRMYSAKYVRKHPEKYKCRMILLNAIRDGKIKRKKKCENCGITGVRIEGHHEDYRKPFEVIWLCTGCHGKLRRI